MTDPAALRARLTDETLAAIYGAAEDAVILANRRRCGPKEIREAIATAMLPLLLEALAPVEATTPQPDETCDTCPDDELVVITGRWAACGVCARLHRWQGVDGPDTSDGDGYWVRANRHDLAPSFTSSLIDTSRLVSVEVRANPPSAPPAPLTCGALCSLGPGYDGACPQPKGHRGPCGPDVSLSLSQIAEALTPDTFDDAQAEHDAMWRRCHKENRSAEEIRDWTDAANAARLRVLLARLRDAAAHQETK